MIDVRVHAAIQPPLTAPKNLLTNMVCPDLLSAYLPNCAKIVRYSSLECFRIKIPVQPHAPLITILKPDACPP